MDINLLITPEFLVMIPVLYGIGEIIKLTGIKNFLIPYILIAVSVVLSVIYCIILYDEITTQKICLGIFQGVLIAITTVGGNQCVKQILKRNEDKAQDEQKTQDDKDDENAQQNEEK